jgi:hypothetical protein
MWKVHTHSTEIVSLRNEMDSELPVTVTAAKSEIWTAEDPESTTETVPGTIGIVVGA